MNDQVGAPGPSGRLLILLPDGRALAMDVKSYQEALVAGEGLCSASTAPTASASCERLLEAGELAGLLGVPTSWVEQKAREGVIPSLEFGRWRRFRRSEVEAAVKANGRKLK